MTLVSTLSLNVFNAVRTQMLLDAASLTRWRPPGLSTVLTDKNVVLMVVSHLLVSADAARVIHSCLRCLQLLVSHHLR